MAVVPRGAGMNKQTENANPRQDFGRRLRKLRQDKGWTLAELAERPQTPASEDFTAFLRGFR